MSYQLGQYEDVVTLFLDSLDVPTHTRVLRDLRRLAELRHNLRGKHTASLGGGLYELRTSFNKMEFRIIYVHHKDDVVLLVPFQKKTQKTPARLLDLARSRYAEIVREEVCVGQIAVH